MSLNSNIGQCMVYNYDWVINSIGCHNFNHGNITMTLQCMMASSTYITHSILHIYGTSGSVAVGHPYGKCLTQQPPSSNLTNMQHSIVTSYDVLQC